MNWLASISALIAALITSISAPATVNAPADRGEQVQVTDTLPPPPVSPTPREIVNGLPYGWMKAEPALEAFQIVARANGWSEGDIEAWTPFMDDVLYGESRYCWNVINTPTMGDESICEVLHNGHNEDAGFGQLTAVHYGKGQWLCVEYGICSKYQIIQDPWTSMEVVVWLIERQGSFPWCWNSWAQGYHKCYLAPDR